MDETALSETFLPLKRRSPNLEEESKSENSSTSTNQDPSAPRKRKCKQMKMNQNLIDKIIAGSKKKKKENKRNDKINNQKPALLPPVIVYKSKGSMTVLTAPSMNIINRLFIQSKPIEKTPQVCACGKTARYRLPKTLEPYCSLECYNALISKN